MPRAVPQVRPASPCIRSCGAWGTVSAENLPRASLEARSQAQRRTRGTELGLPWPCAQPGCFRIRDPRIALTRSWGRGGEEGCWGPLGGRERPTVSSGKVKPAPALSLPYCLCLSLSLPLSPVSLSLPLCLSPSLSLPPCLPLCLSPSLCLCLSLFLPPCLPLPVSPSLSLPPCLSLPVSQLCAYFPGSFCS